MADAEKPGDQRFFARTGPHSTAALAALAGAAATAEVKLISGVAPLQTAGPADVSFLDNRRYADLLAGTRAGAVIVHPDFAARVPAGAVAIVTQEPYVAWARIAALFHPLPAPAPGAHPSAIVDATALVDPGAELGAGCVIGPAAQIGAGTVIGPLSVIGAGVKIGENCRIHAQVTISHAILGDRVVVYPGARIGQDGFGFAIGRTGFIPVPQLGRVLIGDGAEIGANTCIDRGSAQDTLIGPGVHIDNLVQVGHNVRLGANSVIVAQAGISGSTSIGPGAMIGGQAGFVGHLTIGAGARVAAQSGVIRDVAPGEEVMGYPAQPAKRFFREIAMLRKLTAAGKKSGKLGPTE
jgi:UDP-3-O-[3-hydroxymyristoyl] glucosamine N-acyltransferase